MSLWNDDEPGELIAVWDSADSLPAPSCFDTRESPDLVVPAGQHPIEGQIWPGGHVHAARIWIRDAKGGGRRAIEIYVFQMEIEFHHREDSPITLLPDLEFYDEPGFDGSGFEGVRRIDLGLRVMERPRFQVAGEGDDD